MTQDEMIEMARQAGLYFYNFVWTSPTKENLYPEGVNQEALQAFAKLVAAKEREDCAKVCDSFQTRDVGMQPAECAGAIRRRGEQA